MLSAALGGRSGGGVGGLWRSLRRPGGASSAAPPAAGARSLASRSSSLLFPQDRSLGPRPSASNVKPLDGVKILDLTRVLAGPFATMNLGDLGAEVIKVERPGAGDDTRAWGPPFVGKESVYFLSVNRNKKSIAINMKNSRGAKIIRELAAVSDVFVENYVPGKLAEIGLGYEDIKKIAPHIVYCSITGAMPWVFNFCPLPLIIQWMLLKRVWLPLVHSLPPGYGQTGPMVQRGGYDSIAAAVSGLMHITGHEVACLTHVAANYLNCKIEGKRWGTAHGSIVPYQAFKTKDGYIVVGAGNDQQFVTVCKILNLPEVSKDSRYKTNILRVQNRKELIDILSTRFSEKTTSKWLQLFEGSGVPYGPINNMQQVFSDPQVLHNGLLMEMNHPTAGRIVVPGPGVRYSEFAVSHPKPPPLVGQHTVEILKGMLGYEDNAIEELLHTGAVAQHEVR
ncbi:succinyl-CoA:glutarate CoA-transferase isoform X9 [Anas platyrhynchos]|uniref:succinyl-CoA:glutarate CoA-transferase isoform X9 n=1 Tax=Anas platyrhynchos TaxID=8839 RepID=UPI0018D8BCA4|nr:succinate--hydroxymethylglutarate CoA-transferase isoform X9 [Anas platyrhynchos]